MQEEFVRLTRSLADKGKLIPKVQLENPDEYKKILSELGNSDGYTSVYSYPREALDYFNQNDQSIKDYKGPAFSDRLIFDLDSKSDVEVARQDAIKLLKKFKNTYNIEDIRTHAKIFFSGNKGFHVEIPINKLLNPTELKKVCSEIAGDLTSFDTSIYNITRLIRLPNTLHQESKLYKIQLGVGLLQKSTLDEIKNDAKENKNSAEGPVAPISNVEFIESLLKTESKPKSVVVDIDGDLPRGLAEIDFTKCPSHMPRCIYALSKGVMVPSSIDSSWGGRSRIFFRLATYYRNQGMDKEAVGGALKGISRLNSQLYPDVDPISKDEIWNQHIASAFSESAIHRPGGYGTSEENTLLKPYCDCIGSHTTVKCPLHSKSTNQQDVIPIDTISGSFEKFANDLDVNRVFTGIDFIDENMKITRGTTTLLVGAPGSGKTSLALNMLENANKKNQAAMFFSMDMNKHLVYLKLAQKLTTYKQDDILHFYKTKNKAKVDEIRAAIKAHYNKTFFDFSSTLSMEQMRDKILKIQDSQGVDISLVVVDYAGRISSDNKDTYANARHNALKSTDVAEVTDSAWIYINQVSRLQGDANTPLRSKRVAKDSGDWEETATNVITVWRPFAGVPEKDHVMRMFLAKNRMGIEIERPLSWNGARAEIRDMTENEYEEYTDPTTGQETEEKDMFKNRFSR